MAGVLGSKVKSIEPNIDCARMQESAISYLRAAQIRRATGIGCDGSGDFLDRPMCLDAAIQTSQ